MSKRRRKHLIEIDGKTMHSAQLAAERTGYNEQHLRRVARAEGIPGAQLVGNRWFFDLKELKNFLGVIESNNRFTDEDILNDPLVGFV